ncbi:MAG TPA: hypothetical protein VGB13_01410 [Candidatus Krumholzibacteria bacterium]
MELVSLEKPAEHRPWYRRMTVVFGSIFAAVTAAEEMDAIPRGTMEAGATLVQAISGFLAAIGVYRHIQS